MACFYAIVYANSNVRLSLKKIDIEVALVIKESVITLESVIVNRVMEADHYINNLERYGIICYKHLGEARYHFAFAWQIVEAGLFGRFDDEDRGFIWMVAEREREDDWYRWAGEQLKRLGFEGFLASIQ